MNSVTNNDCNVWTSLNMVLDISNYNNDIIIINTLNNFNETLHAIISHTMITMDNTYVMSKTSVMSNTMCGVLNLVINNT